MSIEIKTYENCNLELKSVGDDTYSFEGYAAVFGSVDSYGDIIMPGAFKRTLDHKTKSKNPVYPVCWNHDLINPIGFAPAVNMREDANGLFVKGTIIAKTTEVKQKYALMKEGAVSGMSFRFDAIRSEPSDPYKGEVKGCRRKLHELKLYEVTITGNPANEDAQVLSVKTAMDLTNLVLDMSSVIESMGAKLDELVEKFEATTAKTPEEGEGGSYTTPKEGDTVLPAEGSSATGDELSAEELAALDNLVLEQTTLSNELDARIILNTLNDAAAAPEGGDAGGKAGGADGGT